MTDQDRRLIEDFVPIQAISAEAAREKAVRSGHISTLHLWWARRPLVACRAAVYGALMPVEVRQAEAEEGVPPASESLVNSAEFIEQLCKYPGSPQVIEAAQRRLLQAHAGRLSRENGATHGRSDTGGAPRPKVLDMFAGGGAIPLEALRLGCEAHALDLNPVAHIIELCTLVYPQRYGAPLESLRGCGLEGTWAGLTKEAAYWGEWVLERAQSELSDLYPPIPDPDAPMFRRALGAQQLEISGPGFEAQGQQRFNEVQHSVGLTPVAYLWTRTVRCKDRSCGAIVPLVRQTWLRKRAGRYIALRAAASATAKRVKFEVVQSSTAEGLGFNPAEFSQGGNAVCWFCGAVADADYVQQEGQARQVGVQLMAVACVRHGEQGKTYVSADDIALDRLPLDDSISRRVASLCDATGLTPPTEPISSLRPSPNARGLSAVTRHGLRTFADLFTPRQLLAGLTFAAAVRDSEQAMRERGYDADAAKAVSAILGLALNKVADLNCAFTRWKPDAELCVGAFGRQALGMVWDFAEQVPYSGIGGSWQSQVSRSIEGLTDALGLPSPANVQRGSATALPWEDATFDAVVTDPPYYDNVPYADVSDFFYVWLKRSVGHVFPEHFSSELTPKKAEATALASRHGGDMARATDEYERSMLQAFREAHRVLKSNGLIIVVYAHKTTLGWSTLVDALRRAGFTVTEAWPLDTEMGARLVAMDTAALASSIFLVGRKRLGVRTGSYEDEVQPELEAIVRERVETLWRVGISGADLVIAAVGAGLRAFTRFERVEYANGEEVPAKRFLGEVEGVVLETLLEKIFGVSRSGVSAVDRTSRFYVLWRYTYKAAELEAGEAIVFTYSQPVELDGPQGLSTGSRALVQKKQSKYRLLDFTERGLNEKLGLPDRDGQPAPLIDVLHRTLWLMENEPHSLSRFLNEARPDSERLRLLAHALAGTGLRGTPEEDARTLITTTAPEQSVLARLTANWRSVIEQHLPAAYGPIFATAN